MHSRVMGTDEIFIEVCYTQQRCLPSRLLHLTSANIAALFRSDDKQTGFALKYALHRSGACRPASSTSRPRIYPHYPIRLLRATLTVVVGTCGTLLLRTDG